jgi:peptide/nickel transport system permease protein
MTAVADTLDRPVIWRLRTVLQATGWIGLAIVVIATTLSDFLARAPADAQGVGAPLQAPTFAFPFGTDELGRDVLGESIHALAITFEHALLAAAATVVLGSLFGYVAARSPRMLGELLRWIAGLFGSVPTLLLAILIVGLTSKNYAALAAGLAAAPLAFSRAFDRAQRDEYSTHSGYARATGISASSLLRRDLVYEFRDNFFQTVARAIAAVTITLSTASFLGFGAIPPHRDLGLMIAAARPNFLVAWWTVAFPAIALLLIVLFARLAAGLEEGERP